MENKRQSQLKALRAKRVCSRWCVLCVTCLQTLVILEHLLNRSRGVVVLRSDDLRVHHTGGGIERVDGRVDTELGDRARQHSRGIQVREGGGRRRIGQIIGRHVDRLHGRDRTLLGRRDTLLERTQIRRQRRPESEEGTRTRATHSE